MLVGEPLIDIKSTDSHLTDVVMLPNPLSSASPKLSLVCAVAVEPKQNILQGSRVLRFDQ